MGVGSACGVDGVRARGVGGVPSVGVGVGGQHQSRRCKRCWRGQPGVGAGDARAALDPGGCRSPRLLVEGLVNAEKGSCGRRRPPPGEGDRGRCRAHRGDMARGPASARCLAVCLLDGVAEAHQLLILLQGSGGSGPLPVRRGRSWRGSPSWRC